MECELWGPLYALVWETAKDLRRSRVQFSDALVVLVFLWAVLHDRPCGWACNPDHWKCTRLRPVCLPSQSTLSRRLHRVKRWVWAKLLINAIRIQLHQRLTA